MVGDGGACSQASVVQLICFHLSMSVHIVLCIMKDVCLSPSNTMPLSI